MLPEPEPQAVTLTPRPGGPSGSNSISQVFTLDSAGHVAGQVMGPPLPNPRTDLVLLLTPRLTRQDMPATRL